MAQVEVFVGIDVSKDWLDVAVRPLDQTWRVSNDRTGLEELVRRLRKLRSLKVVGVEATGGYERGPIKALLDAGVPVRRANPLRVRQFAKGCGILAKNDRIDARVIAHYLAVVDGPLAKPNAAAARLAELVTARRQLRDELTRAKNQAQLTELSILVDMAQRRAGRLEEDIVILDRAIAQAIAEDEHLARKDALLRSAPCVGPVVSSTFLALMPELGEVSNRQAAALLGVAPFDHDSGRFKGQRHIGGGRKPPRDVAYMAALVGGVRNPALLAFKQRLQAAGKPPKVILVALMRKLITILNAMLRNNQPWAPA